MAKKNFFKLEPGKFYHMDNQADKIFTKRDSSLMEQVISTGLTQESSVSFDVNAKIFEDVDLNLIKPKKKVFMMAYLGHKFGDSFEIIERRPDLDEYKNYIE